MHYELQWWNSAITGDAKTIDDMIWSLQEALEFLKTMKAAGAVLEYNGTGAHDCALLTTDNPELAKLYDLEEVECENDNWDDDDWDDDDEDEWEDDDEDEEDGEPDDEDHEEDE